MNLSTNPFLEQLLDADIISILENATYRDANLWNAIHHLLDVLDQYNNEDDFSDLLNLWCFYVILSL